MKKIIKKTLWLSVAVIAITGAAVLILRPDWLVIPPFEKTAKAITVQPVAVKKTAQPAIVTTTAPDTSSDQSFTGKSSVAPVTTVTPAKPVAAAQAPVVVSQKDPTPPDPNRPSYDLWGNEWTATGTLIHATCPNVADPISGKDNPECVCPQFIRGFDKDTNAAVCGYVTGCPYGDSVPLGAMCYKNCLNTNPEAATDPTVCEQGTGYTL